MRGSGPDPILAVEALYVGYGQTEILRGVSLAVGQGEIVAVLGSNGVGKSTLNNTLSGLIVPWSGGVRFGGEEVAGWSPQRIVSAGLIHVPEGRRVFPNLSVADNLTLGAYRRGGARREETIERVYDTFPRLAERRTQYAGTLSGGEQQMLAIGRGLMSDPKLLILDEPSLGLSPLLVEEMFGLIATLNKDGLSILLVEQNVAQSLELANRAYVLENGLVATEGEPATLLADDRLRRAYLGL